MNVYIFTYTNKRVYVLKSWEYFMKSDTFAFEGSKHVLIVQYNFWLVWEIYV